MYKALISEDIQAISQAISNGLDVNKATNSVGNEIIPLCYASKVGNIQMVRVLLDSGATINIGDENQGGITPLIIACQSSNIDIIRLLLDSGADINMDCESGFTPLSNACEYEHVDVVRLLIDLGADVNLPSLEGSNPLSISIECENIELVKILLDAHTININSLEDLEEPHLIKAVLTGSYEIIEMLISAGADINIVNEMGETPLMTAIQDRNLLVTKLLLIRGANIPNNLNYLDQEDNENENQYQNDSLDLVKIWPVFITLYGFDYLGLLNYIDPESISILGEYFI